MRFHYYFDVYRLIGCAGGRGAAPVSIGADAEVLGAGGAMPRAEFAHAFS